MNTSWMLACLALAAMPVRADEAAALAAAEAHVTAHEKDIVGELRELLSHPNVATSDADMRANAALLVAMLEKRGVAARVLETAGCAGFGLRRAQDAGREADTPFLCAL